MDSVRGSDKISFQINFSKMADPAKPVLDQPAVPAEPADQDKEESPAESNQTSYLSDPHLLEQSMNSFSSNVAQVSLCHSSYSLWQVVDFWCL
jgi:hypothetical protein